LLRFWNEQGPGGAPPIADENTERIVTLENFRRVVQPWVSWMGLPPDGSPLLLRDIGSQEVYALDFEAP
jgi:hypothetical protein